MGCKSSKNRSVGKEVVEEEEPDDNGPLEEENEEAACLNDKIKLVHSTLHHEPNPAATIELQKSIAKRRFETSELNWHFSRSRFVSTEDDEIQLLDEHAKQAPTEVLNSFTDLVDYLDEPIQDNTNRDQLLIRSFLVWLAHVRTVDTENDQHSVKHFTLSEGRAPHVLLGLLRENQTTYTTLFILLCWAAGIKCVKIDGLCRTGVNKGVTKCIWTAVWIKNTWQIVYPYRVCRALAGNLPKEILELNSKNSPDKWKEMVASSTLEHYVLANPERFIYECYPDDPKWQLLLEPITKDKFLEKEHFYHTWWEMGLRLTSIHKHKLVSKGGGISISFEGVDDSAYGLFLSYDLRLLNSDDESQNYNRDGLQRFVYLLRDGITWHCDILFPVTGTYKILFYAGKSNTSLLRVCDFIIKCEFCHPDPSPLPINPGVIGLGVGPAMFNAGLGHPSHKIGLIRPVLGKTIKMKFHVDKNIESDIAVRGNLLPFENEITEDENMEKLVKVNAMKKRTHKEISIVISSPKDPGQYLLELAVENGSARKRDNKIACYYVIVYEGKQALHEETCAFMSLRKMLQKTLKSEHDTDIMLRIQDLTSKKVPECDEDVQRARGRVAVLNNKRKKRHKNLNLDVEQRIQPLNTVRQVEYEKRLTRIIKQVQKIKTLLKRMESTEQRDATTPKSTTMQTKMSEMKDSVQSAVLLLTTLFGKPSDEGKSSIRRIGEILNELNRHGLILKSQDIKQTRKLVKNYNQKKQPPVLTGVVKVVHDIITAVDGK